jgi:solute carrier family 25 citrate transporter 1
MSKSSNNKKKKHPMLHLVAGGTAGLVESSICHPLDTIKTRMQLRRQQTTMKAIRNRSSLHEPSMTRSMSSLAEPTMNQVHSSTHQTKGGLGQTFNSIVGRAHTQSLNIRASPVQASLGPIGTARRIIQREGFLSLYKGLTAVYMGIVPKMAIRFVSFEQYREVLQSLAGTPPQGSEFSTSVNFSAGLASGLTEAILIVTPAEVCKIRMQSQYNSLVDPAQLARRKYTNVLQTAVVIVKEEGIGALYKGIVPTMLRQGCNQAVNFTMYNIFKRKVLEAQNTKELVHWQSLVLGGISGGFGPMVNNPLDVVKTRMQKQVIKAGTPAKYTGIVQSIGLIAKDEGVASLWKGITPR